MAQPLSCEIVSVSCWLEVLLLDSCWALQALERALRTGVVLLTAAQADTMWSISCGEAIDDAKQVTNRQVITALTPFFDLSECQDNMASNTAFKILFESIRCHGRRFLWQCIPGRLGPLSASVGCVWTQDSNHPSELCLDSGQHPPL